MFKFCIVCGDPVRNKRSCYCQKCFEEFLKAAVENE
jgi:predicted nucleic acid-binding Zn ribbon protein